MTEKEILSKKDRYDIQDLCRIMTVLRSPTGCPWDREQTHKSVRNNLIEETYEAVEAIDTANHELLCEELGDLLMQVVFHSEMAKEEGTFDFSEVAHRVSEKLVRRHPHVFGAEKAENSAEVLQKWDAVKSLEKTERRTASDKMRAIPPSLPALMRAEKIACRAEKETGYRGSTEQLLSAITNTAARLASAEDTERSALSGRLVFLSAELARLRSVSAEEALTRHLESVMDRFTEWEKNEPEEEKKLGFDCTEI